MVSKSKSLIVQYILRSFHVHIILNETQFDHQSYTEVTNFIVDHYLPHLIVMFIENGRQN